jgi:hypothetical protein
VKDLTPSPQKLFHEQSIIHSSQGYNLRDYVHSLIVFVHHAFLSLISRLSVPILKYLRQFTYEEKRFISNL